MAIPPQRPERPRVDPSEFDDPFFGGDKKPPKPNVYMELGNEDVPQQEPMVVSELSPDDIGMIFTEIGRKMEKDYMCELTQLEASLLYQVDQDIPEHIIFYRRSYMDSLQMIARGILLRRGRFDDLTDAEIRQLPDFEQVKSLIIERLRSEKNVIQTYNAFHTVAEHLQRGEKEYDCSQQEFINTLNAKMREWEEQGVFDYLTIELIKNNSRHYLVPTPNVELSHNQIYDLVIAFGEEQLGTSTEKSYYLDVGLYDKFANEALSDFSTDDKPIHFCLIPNGYIDNYSNAINDRDNNLLPEILDRIYSVQDEKPFLGIPSVLDAIVYWFSLRAAEVDLLDQETVGGLTTVNHLNVAPKGKSALSQFYPKSGLDSETGKPYLTGNSVESAITNWRLGVY